jgi:predicted DNA-binding ribbon-helix-helix protein
MPRGGKRKGAGRKSLGLVEKKIPLPAEWWDKLNKIAEEKQTTRTKVIKDIIKSSLFKNNT